jgi:hypothetical protein
VPVLIETSSERNEAPSPETEENEAEIPLGGPSGPPADDSDSDSSLTEAISVTSEVPREEPSGEASENSLAGPGNQDEGGTAVGGLNDQPPPKKYDFFYNINFSTLLAY